MTGRLILVVGPSGVGKDSLIEAAQICLGDNPNFYFPRRYITRPAAAGGENHIEISRARFEEMRDQQAFCLHWGAHNLQYGIPASIKERLKRGQTVFVNGSRSVLRDARRQFDNLVIAAITANEDSLRQRLIERGRESPAEIEKRIQRSQAFILKGRDIVTINNSGLLAHAATELVNLGRIIPLTRAPSQGCNALEA